MFIDYYWHFILVFYLLGINFVLLKVPPDFLVLYSFKKFYNSSSDNVLPVPSD